MGKVSLRRKKSECGDLVMKKGEIVTPCSTHVCSHI